MSAFMVRGGEGGPLGHPPPLRSGDALFLDFDGTLVEFVDDPTAVRVEPALRCALESAAARLAGALALISGRSIEQIDRCFAPLRLPVAGLHGLERRAADGSRSQEQPARALRAAARRLQASVQREGGLFLEDKGATLAIHFRAVPQRRHAAREMAEATLAQLGAGFRLLPGADVIELVPRAASKGAALRAFMREAPYAGRRPVFVGDDVTDLQGFEAARDLGGCGVAVGRRVSADYWLADAAAVGRWLTDGGEARR
jgi:trehalose 6-phosphate phosphatase